MFRIFSKPDCHLCDEAKRIVTTVAAEFGIEVLEINIQDDRQLLQKYRYEIPVVFLGEEEAFRHRITEDALRKIVFERRKGER